MTFLIGTMLVAFVGPITSLAWQSPKVQALATRAFTRPSAQLERTDPSMPAPWVPWAQWLHKGAYGLMLLTLGLNVMPFNFQALGIWSLAITSASAILTWALLKLVSKTHDPKLPLTMMALAGFMIHAMADGASLYSFGGGLQPTWGPALILDRIAVGFFVWLLINGLHLPEELRPYQKLFGWIALFFLCLATALGYYMMLYVVQIVTDPFILGTIQSILAGLVLQLIIGNRHPHGYSKEPRNLSVSPVSSVTQL